MKLTRAFRNLVVIVLGIIAFVLVIALLVYPPVYVFRVMAWQESDAFDWQKFPSHPLQAAPAAYRFDVAPDPQVEELFERLSGAEDWNSFLEANRSSEIQYQSK